jgi:hypothetical protein
MQRIHQAIAARITPANYLEMINQLDIWDKEQANVFRSKTNEYIKCCGSCVLPFRLFRHGSAHFYFISRRRLHLPWEYDADPMGRWTSKRGISTNEYPYMTEFEPPITVPTHLSSSIDGDYSSSLQYGINIGYIRWGNDDNIDDQQKLREAPFVVFLHPVDKSFWIVFNSFPLLEEGGEGVPEEIESVANNDIGFWESIKSKNPVAVWRMSFSDVQRVVLPPSSAAGHVSTGEPEDEGNDNGGPKPQVIVDGYDPAWNSFDPTNPRSIPCEPELSEIQKYRDEVSKSRSTNHQTNTSSAFQSEPNNPKNN